MAQVLARTLTLEATFHTILSQLDRVVPYDSSSIQGGRRVIVGGRGFEEQAAQWDLERVREHTDLIEQERAGVHTALLASRNDTA